MNLVVDFILLSFLIAAFSKRAMILWAEKKNNGSTLWEYQSLIYVDTSIVQNKLVQFNNGMQFWIYWFCLQLVRTAYLAHIKKEILSKVILLKTYRISIFGRQCDHSIRLM